LSSYEAEIGAAKAFLRIVFKDDIDFDKPHFADTPRRFLEMLRERTKPQPFDFTTFESHRDEMVIVKDIPFASTCAHHIVPFVGMAHVGYVPAGELVGLSKIARLVRARAAKLTVQEELTNEVCNEMYIRLHPQGVMVVIEAEHMCMTLRGVQAPGTKTITSSVIGCFADHTKQARNEFLQLIGKNHG
jgi:GTP cyclohydrolase I